MKIIDDDREVKALAMRLGCWPAIAGNIAAGRSGFAVSGRWVFAYFIDGLFAVQTADPLSATTLALRVGAKTLGNMQICLNNVQSMH